MIRHDTMACRNGCDGCNTEQRIDNLIAAIRDAGESITGALRDVATAIDKHDAGEAIDRALRDVATAVTEELRAQEPA